MSTRMPIPLQVTIPASTASYTRSSSPSSSGGTSVGSDTTSSEAYVPVCRRAPASPSSPRSPPLLARVYNITTLLRLSCSPLATQLAAAPAMRAVPRILGVGARRPRKKDTGHSSPTAAIMTTSSSPKVVGDSNSTPAPISPRRRDTSSRGIEGSWRPPYHGQSSAGLIRSATSMVGTA
ncbi:hypothetical protein C8R46DRAFT_1287693 [Mycena filopes]|nr:hypothetical protein C8R46DRAFT_1287693 [Mycena filopes]